jgi:hypothetical protein
MTAPPPLADAGCWLDADASDAALLELLLLPGGGSPRGGSPTRGAGATLLCDPDEVPPLLGAGGAPAWPPLAPPPPPPLRCLDESHGAGCARCAAPPSAEAEHDYQLLLMTSTGEGSDGASGGGSTASKRLRQLLLASPEWNSASARAAAAAREEARGDVCGVAPLLRAKCSKALRKAHLLALCRCWNYGSDLWRRAGAAPRARARAAAPAPAVPRPLAVAERLAAPLAGDASALRALWAPAAACFLGLACRAECAAAGVAFYNAAIDAEFAQFASGSRAAAAQIATLAAAQARWNARVRARLDPAAAARERLPALLVNSASPDGCVPAETALHAFAAVTGVFHAAWRARRASAAAALAASAPALRLGPIDDEAECLYAAAARFMNEALLLLLLLKARGAADEYLSAAVGALDEATLFVRELSDNMAKQREWYAERVACGALRPLASDVAEHRFGEIWDGLARSCERTRCCADDAADGAGGGAAAAAAAAAVRV